MKNFLLVAVLICCAADAGIAAQRRGAGGGPGTFAVSVTDPEGKPIPNVLVTVEGGVTRSVRTEGGRIALESLPPGAYILRFEREGYLTLERELTARGGAPIDVKVTLKPLPAPAPPPPAPPPVAAEPTRPTIDAKPAVVDVPALIEKNWVGRNPSRATPISCGSDGLTQLIQLNEALMPHDHAESDETFYVVAGEGNAMVGAASHRLKAGVLVFVPRGTRHGLAPTGKNPLIVLSARPGEPCK